jgi:hypothetical protein
MDRDQPYDATPESGYKLTLQRNFIIAARELWNLLFSKHGLAIWLGTSQLEKWETGISFETEEGLQGQVRVFKIYSHIRLKWKPDAWNTPGILQIRLTGNGEVTTLVIDHGEIENKDQQDQMYRHWGDVLDEISCTLLGSKSLG